MSRILVIGSMETNSRTGLEEYIASHGINMATDQHVVLPPENMSALGAKFDSELGEYVIDP